MPKPFVDTFSRIPRHYTSVEQGRKLIDMGVPADSADMCWTINDDTMQYNMFPTAIPYYTFTSKSVYVPCWTTGMLIDIFLQCVNAPDEIDVPSVEIQRYERGEMSESPSLVIAMSYIELAIEKGLMDFDKFHQSFNKQQDNG